MFDFLRPSVPISKSFMRIPRICGVLCGIWPQRKRCCIQLLLFGYSTFVVALGAVGENVYGFMHLNDLVDALEAFCPAVTKAICVFKMLIFFVFNQRWYTILLRLRTMIMAEQHNNEKMQHVQKLASIASIFNFILLISGSFTSMSFNIRPLVENIIRSLRGQDVVNDLPFNIVLPEILVNYPYYPMTYFVLALSGTMTVFTFSFVDGFFLCSCTYISGIFHMIQYDIRITFAEIKECEAASLAQNHRIRLQLAAVVKRHNAIIDLCADFTANFTLIILMHFLSAALILCLSILDLMLNSASLALLIYIFYSIAALTQLFLYCIGGNYISESSTAVADTLYDIEWYKCDVKTRKMILMMLRSSQIATKIAVPFFTPSLPAFRSHRHHVDNDDDSDEDGDGVRDEDKDEYYNAQWFEWMFLRNLC